MSEGDFFSSEAKHRTSESVRRVEAQTSAEVVVAVRKRSGHYGVLAYHLGLGVAALVIAYLLVAPTEYSIGAIAIDGLLGFALGTLLAANFDTLLRTLSRATTLRQNLASAARAAFYDLGISRTSGRNGLLVYVSLFERSCVLLTDIGIDAAALGASWVTAQQALESAVKRRDLAAFYRALESLGPVLGSAHPRSEDDVNELPDEVQ
jgi:putative membrane protein